MNNAPLRSNQIVPKAVLACVANTLAGQDVAKPANLQVAEQRVFEQITEISVMDTPLVPCPAPAKFGLDHSDLSYVSGIGNRRAIGIRSDRSIRRPLTPGKRRERCGEQKRAHSEQSVDRDSQYRELYMASRPGEFARLFY